MSNDIRARLPGAHSVGRVHQSGGRSEAGAALSVLAGRIAEQVADHLALAGREHDRDRRGRNFVLPGDLYEVNRQAEELSRKVGAGLAEGARLAQSLHRFAEACATLLAAQPAAFSLERVRAVVDAEAAPLDALETADLACAAIDRASLAIETARW